MPELPEVETVKNGLLAYILNKKIIKVNILFPSLRFLIPPELPKKIQGKKINNIIRRGKYLIFNFDNGDLIIHLGMSGKIKITDKKIRQKHDHFELIFAKVTMQLNDPRRFGCVLWSDNYKEHKLIKNLGIEPFSSDFDKNYLFKKSDRKTSSIKNFIMNSRIIVGIGNIYACESLFKAKINPQMMVCAITQNNFQNLSKIIIEILQVAIQNGGTTLQDFSNVNGEFGYFVQKLQVYGREGKDCLVCKNKILRIVQNQRATFYCSNCQK